MARPDATPGFVASNRAQGYRTTFGRQGIEIVPKPGAGASWRLGVSLTAYGRQDDVRPLPVAEPAAENERVEYQRGPVTEWYVNGPGGLEQGFTVDEPQQAGSAPIVLTMAVEGGLAVRVEDAAAASFLDEAGQRRVRYAGLAAWDAGGRALASRLEASEGELHVIVEVGGARFPVTVDPTFLQEAELEGHGDPTSGGAYEGSAVSVSGDTAIVGAPQDDTTGGFHAGSAHVFVRSGTVWSQQQRLVASDGSAGDSFGFSVSISGDTAIVGAFEDGTAGGAGAGSAYVFVRSGTTWTEQQRIVASDGAGNDWFGTSVSVSGDTAVVGTRLDDTPAGIDAGSAYVFVRSGGFWSEQQKLAASDGAGGDQLGTSVSVFGDTALVGAFGSDPAGVATAGAAYVFVRSGAVWTEQQKLVASDRTAGDAFGYSVSVFVDTAAIGAFHDDTVAGANAGSAYVFVRLGTVWSEQQKFVASDGAMDDEFGTSVSVSGDTALVGAWSHDTTGGADAGSAYVFVRSGTTWTEQQKLLTSDGAAGDNLGVSVSVSGDTAVVGAGGADTAGGVDAGAAYVFARSGTAWSEQQKLLSSDEPAGDRFGYSVAVFRDTAIVGAPSDDTAGGANAGSAYVFVRSGSVWSEQQKLVASDGGAGDEFGFAASIAGDTAVIGAYSDFTAGGQEAGSAYVFVRSGTVWSEQQKLVASDGTFGDHFGVSVSVSGETAVVGAFLDDTAGGSLAGSAYVFVRSGTVWSEQQKLVASDGATGDEFGISVAVSGDTAVVGAFAGDTPGGVDTGSAYVFVRSGTVWSEQQKLVASDGAYGDSFGVSVSVSGDTTAVGAFVADTLGGAAAGSAYVFVRSGAVWSEQQKLVASDGAAGDEFGISVAVSGDTAVVGAYSDDTADGVDAGSAYVFVRSGTAWSEDQKLVANDGATNDYFGVSVSLSGDTVAVGAFFDDTADGVDAGSAYVFGGSSADLRVTKTDGQLMAVPGHPVTYTIEATNAGPDPVSGATVADAVPAALINVTWTCVASPGSTCTSSGSGSINDNITLPLAGTVTYTLTATIDPAATGILANVAIIAAPAGVNDTDPSNNSATDSDSLTPEADLALTKMDSPDPVAPGGALTYTIQLANLGPSASTGMMMTDPLPSEATFVSSTPGAPTCSEMTGTVTCTLLGLPPSASQTVTIQVAVHPSTLGTISNTATVAGNETDPVIGNGSDTEPTVVATNMLSELAHGTELWADLESVGGVADVDLFRIGQKPYSSYEVLVDGTSGDIGIGQGPELDRLASDGMLLQSSVPAGVGASRSLRWENDTAGVVNDQYVRVRSAGCMVTCDPEDVYRIRMRDTTLLVPRFNNSQTQITVLVLQNTAGAPVSGHALFWNTTGTLAATQPFTVGPRAAYVVNTSTIPGLAGIGGTITLSHDGPYGLMVGKAVAVEPATGFVFDTAVEPRRR